MPFYVCLFVINLGTNYEHVQKYVIFPTGCVNFSSLDQGSNCILSPWHLVITLPFNLVITCIFLLKCNKIDLHEKILLLIEKFQTEKCCFHFINYLMLWPEICHLYWKIWEFWGKHQSSLYSWLPIFIPGVSGCITWLSWQDQILLWDFESLFMCKAWWSFEPHIL